MALRVIVVGSGIAGIAAAIRMAVKGHQVSVFESNSFPGGKLSSFSQDGYRFDMGPSLFTMPMYVDRLFELAGKNPAEHFKYNRLEVICRYFWEDKTELTAFDDIEKFKSNVAQNLQIDPVVISDMLADSKRKYELTGRTFLEQSLHKLGTWWDKDVLKALLTLYKLDIFKTMHTVNTRILKHPKLVQFYNRFATYNGSDPYRTSGLLTIIPYLEQGFGAYIPKGGMNSITDSLVELATSLGVEFHFNQRVDEITIADKKAFGVRIAENHYPAELVICNMDVFFAYDRLLPGQKQPKRILKQEKSSSALIFYWGIKKVFPQLDLHNIFFSDNYKTEFKHIAEGRVYHDPTVYVNITSKYVPEDAPEGCENWFTMINVPYNQGQDWDAIISKARKDVLGKLSRILEVDIAALIETEEILDPRTIESKTHSHLGALYGTASNHRMAAFLRHPNFSSGIRGLYFCGGSVHPGGGIPLCLLSAEITDHLIQNDYTS
ncbi:MAG: phytoene desaturase [Saprospiraceae bacterium]|nr:phytoene desaturase [Saprospiraceae bacterium]